MDYDYHQPEGTGFGEVLHEDPFLAIARICLGREMFWTSRNGGHWVVTRGEEIRAILSDPAAFSSRAVFIPPPPHERILPLESDPPEHGVYRRLLNPAFEHAALEPWLREARDLAISRIEEIRPRGSCEFISEFANWFPGVVLFRMYGLEDADRHSLVEWVSASLRPIERVREGKPPFDPTGFLNYIDRIVKERSSGSPRAGLIGDLFRSKLNDHSPLSDEELFGLLHGLIGGGFDTTAATLGWASLFLARNAAHRESLLQVLENPRKLTNAAMELVRRFSVTNIGRVVTRDMAYQGVSLNKGEQLLLQTCLHSLDEAIFDLPTEVDFERPDAGTALAFSQGPHRCPARNLALAELSIFLEEWMKRIPHFEIDPSAPVRTATGIVHSVVSLPLRWKI